MEKRTNIIPIRKIIAAFFMLMLCVNVSAQTYSYTTESAWQKLGAVHSNSGAQQHLIKVGTSHLYKILKISVEDVLTEIIDITIVYSNGEEKKIVVKSVIQANESREFKLGKERAIKSIQLNYNTVPRNGKSATVSIWGS